MNHKTNDNKDGPINFTDIIGVKEDKHEKTCKYILLNQEPYYEEKNLSSQFVDPSYDPIFKKLFSDGFPFNGKKGIDRLLDLLNSIIFPNEENKKFINIIYNSNESNNLDANKKGNLRLDISCKGTIFDNNKKDTIIIDIELQLGNDSFIIERLFKYGSSLYRQFDKETLVLAFLNYDDLSIKS